MTRHEISARSPGRLLSEARLAAGLSQEDLARRAFTTQSAVSRIEHDRVSPGIDTLQRLLAACGYDLVLLAVE